LIREFEFFNTDDVNRKVGRMGFEFTNMQPLEREVAIVSQLKLSFLRRLEELKIWIPIAVSDGGAVLQGRPMVFGLGINPSSFCPPTACT
jgi:hypothetical protein